MKSEPRQDRVPSDNLSRFGRCGLIILEVLNGLFCFLQNSAAKILPHSTTTTSFLLPLEITSAVLLIFPQWQTLSPTMRSILNHRTMSNWVRLRALKQYRLAPLLLRKRKFPYPFLHLSFLAVIANISQCPQVPHSRSLSLFPQTSRRDAPQDLGFGLKPPPSHRTQQRLLH